MHHIAFVKHEANKAFLQAFGKHLRKLREERELSIRQLAAQCDLEHSQIYRIETGEINTTISMAQKIAEGLEIPHQELFNFRFPVKGTK
ncbi:MAG: XRE family transcriptional regulator [Chitinophagaceae bacterium]|nr:MAG: XRE family transcriptional regulator [Chitinophagaceae bacterium]